MSEEKVGFIQGVYEAFNERDLGRALERTPRDFEWIPDERSFEGAIRGRENVQRFLEEQIEVLDLRVEPEEFLTKADRVVAFVRVRGRGQASGAAVNIQVAHVWTFQEGTPVRGEVFAERDKAREAVGLSE